MEMHANMRICHYVHTSHTCVRRSVQINAEIKKELVDKLEEFATYTDSLEEVFENKEQIEVSKFYEKMPKPHAIAIEEWLNDRIYYRNTLSEE